MSLDRLLLEDGAFARIENDETFVLESSEIVNVIETWRGAVEPAESGASGNEIQVWRGAVEPVATVVSVALAFVRNTARNTARNTVRDLAG